MSGDTNIRVTLYHDEKKVADIEVENTVWHSVPETMTRIETMLARVFGRPISIDEPIRVQAQIETRR